MRQTEIERLLPQIFRRTLREGSLLNGLLGAMERLHAPAEEVLAGLDAYFDPRRAPAGFVPFLARWVDLERLLVADQDEFATAAPPFPSGYGRLRELVAEAAALSRWRGTARGLLRFLEVATGVGGFGVDEEVEWSAPLPAPFYGVPIGDGETDADGGVSRVGRRPFHVRVRVPSAAATYGALIGRIVEAEKPAYVTYELQIEGA